MTPLDKALDALETDTRRRENGSSWPVLQARLKLVERVREEVRKALELAGQASLFGQGSKP